MRLLLDTHAFLWAITEPEKLSAKSRAAIEVNANDTFVSSVSLWEISIKVRINKLRLGSNDDLLLAADRTGIQTIPLIPEEATTYGQLAEATHNDPFDRMLVWQAISRKMTLVSGDSEFERFKSDGLKLLWK